MSDKNKALYFVALVPPEPIRSEIHDLKEEVHERYQSKAALKSPPHITLHMPFKFREDREKKIFECLTNSTQSEKPFDISHKGFGCFEPRVIFVNVDLTKDLSEFQTALVRKMRRDLNLDNSDYKNRGFHPHMTVAFRDLKKPKFYEAWSDFETRAIETKWECESVILLKHNGKFWDIYRQFQFSE